MNHLTQLQALDVRISIFHQNILGMTNTLVFKLCQLWHTLGVSGTLPAKSIPVRFDPFRCQNRLLPNHRLTITHLRIFKQWSASRNCFCEDISADICVSRPTTWNAQYRIGGERCCSNIWKVEIHCPDCSSRTVFCGHCGMEFLRWKSEIYIFYSFWLLFQGILGIGGHPLVPGFQNIWSSQAWGDGMLPRKGFCAPSRLS